MRTNVHCAIAILTVVLVTACNKNAVAPKPTNTEQPPSDSLSRYTIEEMSRALDERRNKTQHSHSANDLNNVTDRDLVNGLIRREKMIYPHDLRRDYYEFAVANADYLRDS